MSTRRSIAAVTVAFTLAVSCLSAYASVSGPSLRQYAHHAWRVSDRFAGGEAVLAAVQAISYWLRKLVLSVSMASEPFSGSRSARPFPDRSPIYFFRAKARFGSLRSRV